MFTGIIKKLIDRLTLSQDLPLPHSGLTIKLSGATTADYNGNPERK